MSEPLTQLESQVYHFLIDFLAENTYQPSIREIARQFSIKSTKTVSDLLQSLEGKGYIQRDESRSRGVRLIGFAGAGATQPIALYNRVDSVAPAFRDENRSGFIAVDRRFVPAPDVFWLKAIGANMETRGILEGDYVMVSPSTPPKNGDLVAARVGPATIVRILAQRDTMVVLQSADATEAPMELGPADDFALLGVVCGVFRSYLEHHPQGQPIMPVSDAIVS
jgi:repressor LexA